MPARCAKSSASRHVGEQIERAGRVQRARLQQPGQAGTRHELHGHEAPSLPRAGRVHADRARVLGPLQRPRQIVVLREQLERHVPSEAALDRVVDDRPAPSPELALDAEAADPELS